MQITSLLFLKKSLELLGSSFWVTFYIGPRGAITDDKILWDVLLHFWEHPLEIVARIFDCFMIIKTDRGVQWLLPACSQDITGVLFWHNQTGLYLVHINSVQKALLEDFNHATGALYIIFINGHLSLFFSNIISINNSWRLYLSVWFGLQLS